MGFRQPGVPGVARLWPDVSEAGVAFGVLEFPGQCPHARAVVPKQLRPLWKLTAELLGTQPVAFPLRTISADDDLLEVTDLGQFARDKIERPAVEFVDVAGQHLRGENFIAKALSAFDNPIKCFSNRSWLPVAFSLTARPVGYSARRPGLPGLPWVS